MKLTKKILSVFLAVVMALTCFSVVGSAYFDEPTPNAYGNIETATHHVTIGIQGSHATATWSNTINSIRINDQGDLTSGVIEVNPGETFYAHMLVGIDYYISTIAVHAFFSAGLLDIYEAYVEHGGTRSFSQANYKKFNNNWNPDNLVVATYPQDSASLVVSFSQMVASVHNTTTGVRKYWPTYDDSDQHIIDEYANASGQPDITKWKFFMGTWFPTMDIPYGVKLEGEDAEVPLYSIPLTVPLDAAPGTEYVVELPAECINRPTKTTAYDVFYEIGLAEGYELDENGKVPYDEEWGGAPFDENSILGYNFETDKPGVAPRQYVDCTNARLIVRVPGGEEPTVDYTALEAEVATSAAINVANATTATKAPFQAALADAQAMLASQDAADQAEVDALVDALEAARLALEFNADYSALDAAIQLAGTKTEADYTRASWATMQNKLAAANAVARDLTSDDQGIIDTAAAELNAAITALVPVSGADYTALDAAIALAGTKVEAHYTTASWAAMQTALTAANNVARDLTSEDQGIIDTAAAELNAAITGLEEADADYSALTAAKTLAATKVQGDYTVASWNDFQTAYTAAQNVATGLKAKDQGIIDAAEEALTTAMGNLVALGGADYTALDIAIAAEPQYPESYYTQTTWDAYQTALTAAQNLSRDLKENQQILVDSAKNALVNAFTALSLKPADYSAVEAALGRITTEIEPNVNIFTLEYLAEVAAARDAVVNGKKINEQEIVTGYATAINAVLDNPQYKAATTAPLTAALEEAGALTEANYTPATWAVLADAVADGEALMAKNPLDIRDDADILAAAQAIDDAIDALEAIGADYSELEEQKTRYTNLNTDWYTSATMTAATTAYNAALQVPAGLPLTEQETVTAAANALKAAIDALEEVDANYAALNTAVSQANGKSFYNAQAQMDNYTQESWDAFREIVDSEADVRGLKISQQGIVDAKTAEILDAITNVLVYAPFDYTRTNAELDRLANLNEDDYTPASWANAQNYADAIVFGLDMSSVNQGMINYARLLSAINQLVPAAAADYSAVTAAQEEAAALTEADWTADTWAALEAALAAVVTGLNANHQTEVDAMAQDIYDAIDALEAAEVPVVPADYDALDAALAEAAALTEADWTAETWAVLADAVAAGNAVSRDLTADDQQIINDAAQAITDAIADLEAYVAPVVPADYDALDAALAAAAALTEADWTAETWAVLADAVAAGNEVSRDLTADDQQIINDAAQAITDAIDALEAYVAPATGLVTGVEFTPAVAGKNTFEITVQGRASMVQFVELDHGSGTRSFDRYHDSVTITSYDADGNQVNSLDAALAYEVWTIETKLGAGETALRAKANESRVWEDMDDAYYFNYELMALNSGLVSAELAATEGTKTGPVATTIVVGPDAKQVQLKMDDGSTVTFSAAKASGTDEQGNLIFNMKSWMNHTGENVITVRVYDANGWNTVTTLTYMVNA